MVMRIEKGHDQKYRTPSILLSMFGSLQEAHILLHRVQALTIPSAFWIYQD
ncbi:hypothetical protein C2W64_03092 [Brevibacillus laterosporus]|nr:hypothetical protein C2W64_03092 [Brevibacillus laterosporus]